MKTELQLKAVSFLPVFLPAGDLRTALTTAWGSADGFLLGHAFDGLIWGSLRAGAINLASDAGLVGAALDRDTLLDLRLFDDNVELRVWREAAGLRACRVSEGAGGTESMTFAAWVDQAFELLGAPRPRESAGDFAVRLGRGGQRHAPPRAADRLRVRHYFSRDEESGLLREAAHRILGLTGGV